MLHTSVSLTGKAGHVVSLVNKDLRNEGRAGCIIATEAPHSSVIIVERRKGKGKKNKGKKHKVFGTLHLTRDTNGGWLQVTVMLPSVPAVAILGEYRGPYSVASMTVIISPNNKGTLRKTRGVVVQLPSPP